MRALATIRALGPIDAKSVSRDSMLRWLVVITPAIGLLFRFAVPVVTDVLRTNLDFDLTPYYALIMSFMGVMVGGLVGTLIGFLLLDQRDDQTMSALLVTPLSLADYVAYRLSVPMAFGIVLTALMFPLAGLTDLTVPQVLASALTAAPLAALYALFIGGFAANKVQGFALAKSVGVLFIPVVVAWFMPMPWQLAAGLVPLYWPVKVFWLFDAGAGGAWAYAAAGLAYQFALLWLLARRFARVVRR